VKLLWISSPIGGSLGKIRQTSVRVATFTNLNVVRTLQLLWEVLLWGGT